MFDVRLVAYDPIGKGGARRGPIPRPPSVKWYTRLDDPASLDIEWSEYGPRAEWLRDNGPCELAVEYWDGERWVEPRNGRVVMFGDKYERRADVNRMHGTNGVGIVLLLEGASVWKEGLGSDGKRHMFATPGGIIATLVGEAKARGALPMLSLGFSATRDSNGAPWPQEFARSYSPEDNLWEILRGMHNAGWADFWTQGRTLHMAAPDTGRDLSTGMSPVYLRDVMLEESPEDISWRDMADAALVIGDEGRAWTDTNPAASTPWGRRERVMVMGGITDAGTAQVAMDRELAAGQDASRGLTRQWQWHPAYPGGPETPWMPDRDMRVGDWILADTSEGIRQRVRIADMAIGCDETSITAFVTLGTIRDDLLVRMRKAANAVSGGSSVVASGKPTPPPVNDGRQWPAAPSGLEVMAGTWTNDNGTTQGQVSASWDPVTVDINGNPVTIKGYQLRGRRMSHPQTSWIDIFRDDSSPGSATSAQVGTGEQWAFELAAVSPTYSDVNGPGENTGAFSAPVIVTVQADTQAPGVPSAPVGDSTPGVLAFTWDGLDDRGGEMPPDFARAVLEIEGVTTEQPWTLSGAGTIRIDAGPGEPIRVGGVHRARLKTVDRAGNESGWGAWSGFVTVRDSDIWPAQVPAVSATTTTTLVGDEYVGTITASWTPVSTDIDGRPLEITRYGIRVERDGWGRYDFPAEGTTGTVSNPDFKVGTTWQVRVAATYVNGQHNWTGPYSPPATVTIGPDTVPPAVPSKPVVSSQTAILTVRWDGLTSTGAQMPRDLDYLNVWITGRTDPVRLDRTTRVRNILDVAVGTSYEVKFSAVDFAGNESARSAAAAPVEVMSVLSDTDWAVRMAKQTSWGDNLYPDPLFTNPAQNSLRQGAGAGFTITADTGRIKANTVGAQQVWLTPSGEVDTNAALAAGDTYVVDWTVTTGAAQSDVSLWGYSTSGAVYLRNPTVQAANSTVTYSHAVTPTAGQRIGISVTGAATVSGIRLRRRIVTTDVAPDAITADKIYLNAAFAERVAAALGQFDVVRAGFIKTGDLAADAIDTMTLKSVKIVGSVWTTTDVANRGIWVNGQDNTIKSFNLATGEEEFRLASGDIRITGDFQTTGSYPRVEIKRDLLGAMFAGIRWLPQPGWLSWPELKISSQPWGIDTPGGLYATGGTRYNLTMHPELALRSGYMVGAEERYWPKADLLLGIGGTTHGRIRLEDIGQNRTSVNIWADFIRLESKTGQSISMPVAGSPGDIQIWSANAGVLLRSGNGWITFQGIGATTGGEDLRLESGWRAAYIASESRFKLDQREVPAIPGLLDLTPKTWVDKSKHDEDPDYAERYCGLVVEDVEQVLADMPAEDREHVECLIRTYDRGDGTSTRTIPYGQAWPLFIPLMREMWDAIVDLRSREGGP